jgi:Flp pilus assembly CpaF family ATPase
MTTIHSNNAAGAFDRFAQFCEEAGVPPQWRLMQSTIDVVCHMEMVGNERKLIELMEVEHNENIATIPIRLKQLDNNS